MRFDNFPQQGVVDTVAQSGLVGQLALQGLKASLREQGLRVVLTSSRRWRGSQGGWCGGTSFGFWWCLWCLWDPVLLPVRQLHACVDVAGNQRTQKANVTMPTLNSGRAAVDVCWFDQHGWQLPKEAEQLGRRREELFKFCGELKRGCACPLPCVLKLCWARVF